MLANNEEAVNTYYVVSFKGKKWVKLLYHDIRKGDQFENEKQALHYINESNKNIYSVIDDFKRYPRIDGKYEFIVDYPEINKYFQWKQNRFPLFEQDYINKTSVDGTVNIYPPGESFHGLARSLNWSDNCQSCLFDNEIGSKGFFGCVALMSCREGWDHSKIPGIKNNEVYVMNFWMRIKDSSLCTREFKHCRIYNYNLIFFIALIA